MGRWVSATLLVTLLAACGGTQTQTSSSATSDSQKPAWEPPPLPTDGPIGMLGISPPDKPWPEMTYDEKEWYMIGKVHPIMRQVFQTWDHDKYEGVKFECEPCHGPDAKAKKYKMPSDHLSPVPAYDSQDFKAMYNSRIVQFMVKRVTPVMGQLIDAPAFNPETGEGFSCYGCHPQG
jgi:hypothetical protein